MSKPRYIPPRSRRGGLWVWYRALVVVVAVILVGLPWCRSDRSGFVARGHATIVSDSREPEAHAHLQPLVEEILLAATTDELLVQYLSQDQQLREDLKVADDSDALEILRRRLEVTPHRVGGQVTLRLNYYGEDRLACSRLLSRIVQDFDREFNDWKREKVSGIEDTYLDQLKSTQNEVAALDAELRVLEAARPGSMPPAPTKQPLPRDPAWVQARQQLEQAELRLKELLETRTPRHPVVLDHQKKLEQLQVQFASLAEYPSQPLPPEPMSDSQKIAEQHQQRIAALRTELQQNQTRLDALKLREKDAAKALSFLSGITMQHLGDIEVTSLGGIWRSTALLVLGGWAVFAGLIAFQMAASSASPVVISSPHKLAVATPIPVAGTITLTGGEQPGTKRHWQFRRTSFLLTRLAELTIVTVIGLVVLATQTQPEFSLLMRDDPLAAMRELLRSLIPTLP
ncbi:hypothetical protein Pan97_43130 [Bremerella volcania]|uniref:Uncharacterized protein n=1 Tax=Bremerella volcania TaxID=2527984 RepID=A0A518CDF6_9BACT|nr:hypothetical protein [Bremerella volcania]QDU77248.1 hypothetical protein Pan97_43130 [Bremerella volcania]